MLVAILAAVLLLPVAVSTPAAEAGGKACKKRNAEPETIRAKKAERVVLCLLNRKRARHDVSKLRPQRKLRQAARKHSRYMVRKRCFAHVCAGEGDLFDRLKGAGYLSGLDGLRGWSYGENIGWGEGRLGSPRAIVRSWMRSEGHRRNILDRKFEHIGIGLVWGSPSGGGGPAGTYTNTFGRRDR